MTYDNWQSFKIADLCEVVRKTINPMHHPNEIFELYSLPAFDNDKTPEKLLGDAIKSNKVVLENDVILINKLNVRFKRIWSLSNVAENSVSSTEYLVIKPKPLVDKNFLYYYLIGDLFTNTIDGARTGTSNSHQRVKKEFILGQKLNLPTFGHQEAIANLLKSFDDKIEINNKINKNLEELAQTLYKQWFVDFEFPNEEGKPYKSSGGEMLDSELGMIPLGFRVTVLSEIVDKINGFSYKGSDLIDSSTGLVTIKNSNKERSFNEGGFKSIGVSNRVKNHHYCKPGDVLITCTDVTQNADYIGNSIYIYTMNKYNRLIFSMDLIKLKKINKKISNEFIYELTRTQRFKNFSLGYVTGTTVLHLDKRLINEYRFVLPPYDLLDKFQELIKAIHNKISNGMIQNQSLIELRDLLLPKLMSGEIEV